jgi:hypothetical protein
MNALRCNPGEKLWDCKKNDRPQDPFARPAVDVEIDSTLLPKADARGGQSAERRGNRQIEQQLQQVEKELRHRHPALLTECLALE